MPKKETKAYYALLTFLERFICEIYWQMKCPKIAGHKGVSVYKPRVILVISFSNFTNHNKNNTQFINWEWIDKFLDCSYATKMKLHNIDLFQKTASTSFVHLNKARLTRIFFNFSNAIPQFVWLFTHFVRFFNEKLFFLLSWVVFGFHFFRKISDSQLLKACE